MFLDSTSFTLRRLWTRPLCRIATLSALCVLQPALASAQLVIGEFRLRGPSGANDEFVEIYNNSGGNHTVAAISGTGYGLAASDGVTRCTIPNGTVIPTRGHYLCVNSVRLLARLLSCRQRHDGDRGRHLHDQHCRQRRSGLVQQQHGRRQLHPRESTRRRRLHVRGQRLYIRRARVIRR